MLLLHMQIRRYFNKICDNNLYRFVPQNLVDLFLSGILNINNTSVDIHGEMLRHNSIGLFYNSIKV